MTQPTIVIRPALAADFTALYALGSATKELEVSSKFAFMDEDEFRAALGNTADVFLVVEQGNDLIGFLYADTADLDRPLRKKWACLVYLAVAPSARHQGIATRLYDEAVVRLKARGATHLYLWANAEGHTAIIEFMKKQGFNEGHHYIWMDKEL
jgi:GNAT superfamily N-acetyltransferase